MTTTTTREAMIRELRAACQIDSERLEIERTVRAADIRARLDAASPGPWYTHPVDGVIRILCRTSTHTVNKVASVLRTCRHQQQDAALIANAPADLAWLLAQNDRLRAERDLLLGRADADAELAYWELRAAHRQAERGAAR